MSHHATETWPPTDSKCDTIHSGADGSLQHMSMPDEAATANPGPHHWLPQPTGHDVTQALIGKDALDTAAQQELRAAVRSLLGPHGAESSLGGSVASNRESREALWGALSALLMRAGVGSVRGGHHSQCRWTTLSVVAQELGRVVVDLPFLTSAITAAAIAERVAAYDLAASLTQGRSTAVFLTPYEQPFQATSARSFHDGRVWARVRGVAGVVGAQTMLILCDDKLIGFEPQWSELTAAPCLDSTRTLVDVDVQGAHGTILAEGDRAAYAVRAAAEATSAMLAVEQASLAATCAVMLGTTPGVDADQLGTTVDKAIWSANYAVQCIAEDDPHASVAVATARMLCSTASFRAARLLTPDRTSAAHAVDAFAQRSRGSAMAFGGPQWHRRRLAQLTTSPLSVAHSR